MSTESWLNAVDEERVITQAKALNDNQERLGANATMDLSQRIGEIYRANPWMKPGEILALAKAQASPELVNAASDLSARQVSARTETPSNKGWFTRNVYDKFKTGARWTFSALNLAPELTTNVASQLFSANDPSGFDGWFKSTSLGTMLANSGEAGEGFFLGGTAAEKQADRARRVRGTINGQAWTVGRGAANIYFTPGSKEYNFLSGIVDGAVAVFADPTLVAGKVSAGVKAARLIPALGKAEEVSAAARIAQPESGRCDCRQRSRPAGVIERVVQSQTAVHRERDEMKPIACRSRQINKAEHASARGLGFDRDVIGGKLRRQVRARAC